MRNIFLIIIIGLLSTGCTTLKKTTKAVTTPVKAVVLMPVKTVIVIGENGQRIVTNYYSTLEDLNANKEDDTIIILWEKEF